MRVRDLRSGNVTGRKARTLLIEGRDDVRQALGGRLRGLGDFDVVADTSSQTRALDLAARLSPELILVEFATTAPYAAELCARIRQASPRSLIVVLTSFADAETRSRYEQAGATACLLKDIGFGRLVDELRALLSDRSRAGA
jgi:DNA-binding NarL/FixJ family response regulator